MRPHIIDYQDQDSATASRGEADLDDSAQARRQRRQQVARREAAEVHKATERALRRRSAWREVMEPQFA